MATVTALRDRPRGRVVVELDGAPWRVLPVDAVVRAGLAVGREFDREAARRLGRELRRAKALVVATRSLRARDLSSRRLAERLERAGAPPAARREALAVLEQAGLVDDAGFALKRAESLAARGYGDAAIAADLDRQGVPTDLRVRAVAGLDPESERAREVILKRGEGAKTARFLAARGFGEDAVEAALDAGFANSP